ncbi:MAG: hypothetical protein HY423_15345 [Candidatus Lambdaproteobacteria bacterium]|nr:hypothetical protein [Candidatus Lambdaproteobacteria bacterium]
MSAQASRYEIGKPYPVVAHHATFEDRGGIHKDGLPQKLGFRAALVLGLVTYGNMTRALVSRFGEEWLGKAVIEVKFLKPVCDGDRMRIESRPIPGRERERAFEVTAYNEAMNGDVSVRMETWLPDPFPALDANAALKPIEWEGERKPRTWDNQVIGQPFRSFRYTPTLETNRFWLGVTGDDLPIYQQGDRPPLFPSQVLRHVQEATAHQFLSVAGLHSSSRAVVRRMLRVGDPIQVVTVPVNKWKKKGNNWTTMYSAVRSGDQVCVEVFHTQIFQLRGVDAA